jgi:hypothetical protein
MHPVHGAEDQDGDSRTVASSSYENAPTVTNCPHVVHILPSLV